MSKLTVLVVSYNFEKWIEQCLQSIIEQKTNFDFDIFIRDDNSTDLTRQIIKNFVENQDNKSRFKLFFEEINLGIHKNYQILISNCESQYICYIDGDDYFTDPTRLQNQVDFLDQNPEYIIHSTSYKHHMSDDTIYPVGWWFGPLKVSCEIGDIVEKNLILFGRTFRNLGNEFEKLWNNENWLIIKWEDWFLNFFLLKYGKSCCYDYPTGHYRQTGVGRLSSLPPDMVQYHEDECRKILRKEYENFLASKL